VWEDQASLDAFAASDPHRAITRRLRPLMGPTRFEFFQIPGSDCRRKLNTDPGAASEF